MQNTMVQSVALKFSISDKTLFKKTLRLRVVPLDLSLGVHPVARPQAPATDMPNRCDGFLYRSLPLLQPMPVLSNQAVYLVYVPQHYRRYYIEFAQSDFSGYEQKFSAKSRSTIKRKLRKFTEFCAGHLQWGVYRSPAEMRQFYQYAREVSRKTYQEKLLDAGLPESDEFYQGMLSMAEADAVRGFLLFHADKPVAYLYCPVHNGVVLYQYLGYDPDYMSWSVGTLLQWLALQALFAEHKFTFFDFTEGESEHKRLFATHHILCADVYFLKRRGNVVVWVYANALLNGLIAWAAGLLDRVGLRKRIRKWIRFGA